MPDPARLRTVREAALQSGKPLVVDTSTTRYVFDYQSPPGTLHAEYIAPWDDQANARGVDSRTKTYWVVTPPTLDDPGSGLP